MTLSQETSWYLIPAVCHLWFGATKRVNTSSQGTHRFPMLFSFFLKIKRKPDRTEKQEN